jgi:VWFA-related protein
MGNRFLNLIVLWFSFSLSFSMGLADASPLSFTLSQVDICLPDIKIYASLMDESGSPVPFSSVNDITIKLDGQPIPVERITPFKDANEGVAYTFLLDISKTMAGAPFQNAVSAMEKLIKNMNARDCSAIITFGDQAAVISDFTKDQESLISELNGIKPDHNNTHFYEAIDKAFDLNKRRDPTLPIRRTILVITDGKDEGSGIILDDLLDRNEKIGIPIYSIGYTRIEPIHLDNLKRLSKLSGGHFLKSEDAQEFTRIYEKTFGDIQSQFVIETAFPSGRADGSMHQIYVEYKNNDTIIPAGKRVSFLFAKPTLPPSPSPLPPKSNNIWIYIIFGAAGLLLIIICFLIVKKRQISQELDEAHNYETFSDQTKNRYQDFSKPSLKILEEANLPVLQFTVIKGRSEGENYTVSVGHKGRTLGREGADIVLNDDEVSKIHCSVSWINNRFMLKDEGSKNGTFLNGIPLKTRSIIEDGDIIETGQIRLRMKIIKTP